MNLEKALSHLLGQVEEPVLTRYRVAALVYRVYASKSVGGEAVRLGKKTASPAEFARAMKLLDRSGILESHPSFEDRAFRLIGRSEDRPEEIACSIDPFCYVSHLSAMEYHGLTNRLPVKLCLTTPENKQWQEKARERMSKDLGEHFQDYLAEGMPRLEKINMPKVNKTEIYRFHSKQWSSFLKVRGRTVRVSTIGRTFLDMLRRPELCGGMPHALEVFEEHAQTYLQPILSEIDKWGGPIDKVRAGYILEEMLGLESPTISTWESCISRGGSRKLDSSEEYVPKWSEKWCLSLNV